jgi:lysophospholipase L1-like esterase
MKRILCYGDSNTWGTAPMKSGDDVHRYEPHIRWPGVMASGLGADWTLVEEGLGGRTTVHDDPIEGIHKNGKTYLQPCLESHWPLDAIAVMLGTNDLKYKFSLNPEDIAAGAGVLLYMINALVPPWTAKPKVLLICPPPAFAAGWLAPIFIGADEKARKLAPLYKIYADRFGAAFFDAGTVAKCSPVDGVHLEAADQQAIGRAVAAEIKKLVG